MRYLALLVILTASLSAQVVHPQSAPERDKPAPVKYFGNPVAIETGKTLFETVCSGCHGPHGEGGRGPRLINAENTRRASNRQLFGWINKGIPGTDMPPNALPDEQIWTLAAFVRNLSAPAYAQPLPGDPDAGREIYFGKGGCPQCHMIRGQGGMLGPDLSDAGATNKQTQLREAVVEPNKRISDGFTPVVVTLKDGKEISGVAKNYSNYSMQLLDAKGELHLLPKAELQRVVFRAKSWMPDDYSKRLSAAEIDNLIAFLSRQVIRVPLSDLDENGEPKREHDDN